MEKVVNALPLVIGMGILGVLGRTILVGDVSRRLILIVVVVGLGVCIAAAVRDGYGVSPDAVIAFTGLPATLFSLLGAAILGLTVFAMFQQSPASLKPIAVILTTLIAIKLIAMEALRLFH